MRKLGIPDSAGITGRTLGHTVKLPAAVTHIKVISCIYTLNTKGIVPMHLLANKGSIILGHPYRHLSLDLFTICTFYKHEFARTVFKDITCLSTICDPMYAVHISEMFQVICFCSLSWIKLQFWLSYHLVRTNRRKPDIKIYSWSQYETSVKKCDWHILAGNEGRIKCSALFDSVTYLVTYQTTTAHHKWIWILAVKLLSYYMITFNTVLYLNHKNS